MKKHFIVIIICAMLFSCGGRMTKKKALDQTLYQYAKVIRWADYDTAMTFFSPDIDIAHKPSRLDIQRLKQFNVSSYVAAPILPGETENAIIQDVKLKLYNLHTKREREVIDRQVWEYDSETKRWLLTSGFPKLLHNR
ncbi:MAG: hypothetical protein R3E90_04815 [Marinicella sp.]